MPMPAKDDEEMTTLDLIEKCVERAASPQQLAGVRLTASLLRETDPRETKQVVRAVEFALATLLLVLGEQDYENFCRDLSANAIRGVRVFNALIAQAQAIGAAPVLASIDDQKRKLQETKH